MMRTLLLLCIGAAVIGTFYFLWQKAQPKVIVYEIVRPERDTIETKAVATGKVEPRYEVEIKPQISGIIAELKKEAGQLVKSGEIIATVKVIPEMVQLNSAESRVNVAKISLEQVEATYNRDKELYEMGVISSEEFDLSKANYLKAVEERDNAQSALEIIRDGIAKNSNIMSTTQIRSTIDGMILDIPVKEGNSVILSNNFNDGTTIATVADMSDMIFKGTASGCSVKQMGFSCCRSDVEGTAGSMSNSALSIAVTVGVDAGIEVIKWLGSPFVYDILNSFESTQGVLTALYGTAGTGVYEPSLSYYGVSVGVSAGGSLTLEFSPMSFLASIALEMASEYFSCTDNDRMHALRKSRGLCHYVGSFCEKTSGLGCLEKKESWVCFNSRIAKAVQEQGRRQLGIGWGTPESPLARGFTLEEFQQLDFTKMDLSAVVSEMAAVAAENGALTNTKVKVDAVKARAAERVKQAAAAGDQYTEVNTVTGKCFVGEAQKGGVDCTVVKTLLGGYADAAGTGLSGARGSLAVKSFVSGGL